MTTRWNKGDSYPEDWPQWLKDADIKWCDVEIKDGWVIWHNGTWLKGTWHNGTWLYGAWLEGTWRSGTWHDGIWQGGFWHKGFWFNGTWWRGIWRSGTWHDGTWRDGVWLSGTWEGGLQRRPRFGWSVERDGQISGFLEDSLTSLRCEEWERHLAKMEPKKVLEYRLLVQWAKALEEISNPPKETLTLWEHLLD